MFEKATDCCPNCEFDYSGMCGKLSEIDGRGREDMPRGQRQHVNTSYTRASTTPSSRPRSIEAFHESFIPPPRQPTGLTPLAAYLEQESGGLLSRQELVEQFQEYDCPHESQTISGSTAEKLILVCHDCGLVSSKFKPGRKHG
jgi:hypothetical protein